MEPILRDVRTRLHEEIKTLNSKSNMSPSELENLYKAICILEKISKIEVDEMMLIGDISSARSYGNPMMGMREQFPNFPISYGDTSQARMRNPNNGQYMSGGYPYSYADGRMYSGDDMRDHMIEKLRKRAREATNDQERREIEMEIDMLMNR